MGSKAKANSDLRAQLSQALGFRLSMHLDDFVGCIVVQPFPPYTDDPLDFRTDCIRCVGPMGLALSQLEEVANERYGDDWMIHSAEVYPEGHVMLVTTTPPSLDA